MDMQETETVHAQAIVIDGHADTPQRFADDGWNFSDPLEAGVFPGMINLESARLGNLAAQFFAVWVEPKEWRGRFAFRTLQLIDSVYEQLRRHPETMRLGLTADDIVAAHRDGVFCALMGIEGGHSIEANLGLLRMYYRLGVRYMTLTWTNTNEWADSSGDLDDATVKHHGGLSEFGRDVIREMNRLGMMVDVSHVSDATFWDVLKTSRTPIIASHSSARTLTQSMRNLTDEQLRAVATSNGVVMVNFYGPFVDENFRKAWKASEGLRHPLHEEAARPYRERGEPVPYAVPLAVDRAFLEQHGHVLTRPPFESLVDHFDHVAQVAGIDHVGIGSDFDGYAVLPAGMESAADLPKITEALHKRGYTAEQLKKLLGGNLLRVMRDVQAEAGK
ncbi:MAG: dipeptidase [Acidobacteriota bacterium]